MSTKIGNEIKYDIIKTVNITERSSIEELNDCYCSSTVNNDPRYRSFRKLRTSVAVTVRYV